MRKTFNAVFDLLTGFNLHRELQKVLEIDSWDRSAIEQYQKEKFENLIKFALKTEIYKNYRSKYFNKFPIFPKEYLQENIDLFRTSKKKPYRLIYTSGSTGNPKKIYVSKEMLLAKRTSYLKMLHWYGLKREDKEVYIGGLSQPLSLMVYYFFKNKVYLPSNDITREKAKKYIKTINWHKPKIIFAYPFALDLIISYAEQLKEKIHQPYVVCTGAENLEPEVRHHLQQHFPDSYLVNEYWSTEANIGVTCPKGNIHADEDTIIIETDNLDENGFGDLYITNFYSYDLPLIRYDMGDRIRLSDKPCMCGRKTKVIEEIIGRTVDYYYLKDGRRIAYMDMRISRYVENVIQYQVIHNKKDDTFLFKYILRDKNLSIDKDPLRDFFRKNLGVELYFKEVDHIPFEPSGKFKVYKSE